MVERTDNSSVRERFHALHHGATPFLLPNAWDFVSAAALCEAGFPAVATTSLGVAAAHGHSDGVGDGREETVTLARRLGRLACPFTVDIEHGFSTDPGTVAALAAELADAGAAGINLEDARADGTLADVGRQAELLAAVKERAPGLFLNARTDTHWVGTDEPSRPKVALSRAQRYVRAGADGIFVPGVQHAQAISTLVAEIPVPLNVLFVSGGHSLARLAELGVCRISTGSLPFRMAVQAAVDTVTRIGADEPIPATSYSYQEIGRLVAG